MAQIVEIHPDNPQERLIAPIVSVIRRGGIIVYPTDTGYALGFRLGDKGARERINQARQLDKSHPFTLACRSLSEVSYYAVMNNTAFPLLKTHTPGPYTFIMRATKEVPKRLTNQKRKSVGIRLPDSPVALAIMEALGEPLMTSSLALPGRHDPLVHIHEIDDAFAYLVDAIIDAGPGEDAVTSVIDLTGDEPRVVREGKGDVSDFL